MMRSATSSLALVIMIFILSTTLHDAHILSGRSTSMNLALSFIPSFSYGVPIKHSAEGTRGVYMAGCILHIFCLGF